MHYTVSDIQLRRISVLYSQSEQSLRVRGGVHVYVHGVAL
jgi:hypothetical protein